MAIPVWHSRMKIALTKLQAFFPVSQSVGVLFAFFGDDVFVALVLLPAANETSICTHRVLLQTAASPVFPRLNEKVEKVAIFAGLDDHLRARLGYGHGI